MVYRERRTPEQIERERRIINNVWTVLDNAPEKILEHVSNPEQFSAAEDAPATETPDTVILSLAGDPDN